MRNRIPLYAHVDTSRPHGNPRPLTNHTYPEKLRVHRVPFNETHLVTIYLHNTHNTATIKVLGDLGRATDVLVAEVPPNSTIPLGPFLLSSTDRRRARLFLGAVTNASNLLVSGHAQKQEW